MEILLALVDLHLCVQLTWQDVQSAPTTCPDANALIWSECLCSKVKILLCIECLGLEGNAYDLKQCLGSDTFQTFMEAFAVVYFKKLGLQVLF